MKRHDHAAPHTRLRRLLRPVPAALLAAALLLTSAPLTGCVELSRTEKSRFGNPLQSHTAGPRNRFDADHYEPPTRPGKPWYQQLFDW